MKTMYSYTTMTLIDVLKIEPDLFENIAMDTSDRTTAFIDTFKAMYNINSIGAETIELFKIWIENKFNEIKRYYNQKLDIYEKQLDGDDGRKIVRVKQEATHNRVDNTGSSSHQENNSSTTINYDLPRNNTNTEYPTTKTSVTGNVNGTNNITNASEGNGTNNSNETITGDVNVIEQRQKWLSFIRDIYRDMCKEFKDCFALIYF